MDRIRSCTTAYILGDLHCSSPWYNRNGWQGVKHQLTYSSIQVGNATTATKYSKETQLDSCLWDWAEHGSSQDVFTYMGLICWMHGKKRVSYFNLIFCVGGSTKILRCRHLSAISFHAKSFRSHTAAVIIITGILWETACPSISMYKVVRCWILSQLHRVTLGQITAQNSFTPVQNTTNH